MQSQSFTDKTIGSLILLPEILEIFQKIKIPKLDLCKLRTLSISPHQAFKPIHLKRFKKACARIDLWTSELESMGQARVYIQKKEPGNFIKILSNENWDKFYKDWAYFCHSVSVTIFCNNIGGSAGSDDGFIQFVSIISSLGPHISEISINNRYSSSLPEELAGDIGKLLKPFINLKKINLLNSITLANLILLQAHLSSNIQIYLSVGDDELDQTLLAHSNIFFKFYIYIRSLSGEQIPRFQNLLKKYKKFIPDRIGFSVSVFPISHATEMLSITQILLENQKCIKKLTLSLRPDPQLASRPEDQAIMEKCLLKLSGTITILKLNQDSSAKLDLFHGIPFWPKLTYLDIRGYEHILHILKRSPKLDIVHLIGINWNSCIFHNDQNTEEQNLQEYFGHLKKLKTISVYGYGLGEKAENIRAKLQTIVPSYTKVWGFYSQ